ncbi:PEP-utilizing enzyme [Micromonospora sp. NPDC049662]|uniref:PEP-utilizing enzyme n=1 Tax=Micromonospora sp. NPDC049662 TaxID=3155397 RepID=UPI00342E8AAA
MEGQRMGSRPSSSASITGTPASPGVATGRARVMASSRQGSALDPGDILVAVITDPLSFADLIEHAAALVTDLGGLASHPAILARELGIPCVVGTRIGTQAIPDGATVVVDGTAGTVDVVG